MACEYQLPGTDTWISENEFKQMLHDGLLDKVMIDNNLAIRGIKPDQAKADSYSGVAPKAETKPVETTAPVTEAPKAEVKEELNPQVESAKNRFIEDYLAIPERNTAQRRRTREYISGKQSSLDRNEGKGAELALNEIYKLEQEKEAAPKAETKTQPVVAETKANKEGFIPVEATVRTGKVQPKYSESGKLDPKSHYSAKISEDGKTASVNDGNGKPFVINGTIKTNQDTGTRFVVGPNGTTIYIDKTIPSAINTGAKTQEQEDKENRGKRQEVTLPREGNIPPRKMVFNRRKNTWQLEKDGKLEDVSERIQEQARAEWESRQAKPLTVSQKTQEEKERIAAEIEQEIENEGKTDPDVAEALDTPEVKEAIEVMAASEVEDTISKYEEELSNLENDIDWSLDKIEEIKEQIEIEKGNLKEEKERIKDEKEAVRKSKMSKAKKEERLEELDSELEDIKEDHDALIESYRDDINLEKSDIKKNKKKQQRIKDKANNKKGGSYSATQRRNNNTQFVDRVLALLANAFPNMSLVKGGIVLDQSAFDAVATNLGRSLGEAAIFDHNSGIIYFNPSVANENTAFEEYAHLYLLVAEQINTPIYNMGISLIQTEEGKAYMDEVENDPGYSDIKNDKQKVAFEALSKMIADKAEKVREAREKSPLKEWLKDFMKMVTRKIFGFTDKLDVSRDTLESYTDLIARELTKGRAISDVTKEQIASIKGTNKDADISNEINMEVRSVAYPQSKMVAALRGLLAADRGLGKKTSRNIRKARNLIAVQTLRANAIINKMNKGINNYVDESSADKLETKQKIDRALKDPIFRADWFATDALASQYISPSVNAMRSLIDDLSNRLAKEGFIGENLQATLTANNDMYVHSSYYAFADTGYKGDWLDLFSKEDKNEIINWMYQGAWQKAESLTYKVNADKTVTASFMNRFGVKSNEQDFKNIQAFKDFVQDNVKYSFNDKAKVNLRKLGITNTAMGDTIEFKQPMNIQGGFEFEFRKDPIITNLNQLVKDKEKLVDFISHNNKLITPAAKSAFKKKNVNLDETYKKFLMEVRDPATNFLSTISKQSSLLFKGQLEQSILDSKYLSSDTQTTNLKEPIKLQGKDVFVSKEMKDFLTGRSVGESLSKNPIMKAIMAGSSMEKAYLTVFNIGSNAANYASGYYQLAKTGNLPIGMITAMRAVEQTFSKPGVSSEEIASAVFNTVPTIIRHLTKLNGETQKMKNAQVELTEDQKKYFGVNDYNSLTPTQKSQLLMEELVSNGIVNDNIDSEVIKKGLEIAFSGQELPAEALQSMKDKILSKSKKGFENTMDAAGAAYSFSDSMFKTIAYMQEKQRYMDTYGAVLLARGVDPSSVQTKMQEKAADTVREQMPSYDRSPELLKAFSRVPLLGTFIQFDFQNKINDKNIIIDSISLLNDGRKMLAEAVKTSDPNLSKALSSAGTKLIIRSAVKSAGAFASLTASTFLYSLIASSFGWDDDDREALGKVLPEYRRYNILIPADSNKSGVHKFYDISRFDPSSSYVKYFRAFKEEGFQAMIDEILNPYTSPDIFVGSIYETWAGLDKYGNVDEQLRNGSILDKLKYLFDQRLLDSGVYGAAKKIFTAKEGKELSRGVNMSMSDELLNTYFGIKPRTINMPVALSKTIKYEYSGKLAELPAVSDLSDAVKNRDKIREQSTRSAQTKVTLADVKEAQAEVDRLIILAEEEANQNLQEARDLVNQFRQMGMTEEKIKEEFNFKISKDDKTVPKWYTNALFNPDFKIKYDNDGDIIKSSGGSGGGSDEYGLDLGGDYGLDLGGF
jgi:hypothetical protein